MGHSEKLRAGLDSGSPWPSGLSGVLRLPVRPGARALLSGSIPAAAACVILALVAACSPPPPALAPLVVAPMPRQYTCEQSRQLANEFAALPAGAMLKTAIIDYGQERDELRAVHGLPRPAPCP